MTKRTTKRILLSILCVFFALLTVVISYAAYVLLSYRRIEDYQVLTVSAAKSSCATCNKNRYTPAKSERTLADSPAESGGDNAKTNDSAANVKAGGTANNTAGTAGETANVSEKQSEDELEVPCVVSELQTNFLYTITTYNIGFGAYTRDFTFFMDGGKESRAASKESVETHVNSALQRIKSLDPDFALFQEVDTDSTRSHHVNQKEMARNVFDEYASVFAVNYHSAYLMYPLTEPHGKSNSGILSFSKTGISSALRRSLPVADNVKKLLDLDRCYSVSRMPMQNGKEFILYNVHTSAYGGSDEIRAAQMTMLFSDMQAEYNSGNYCVAGGDFNHDFTGTSVRDINGEEGETAFEWAQPFPADLLPENVLRATDYTNKQILPTCRNCDVPYEEGNYTVIVDGFLCTSNVRVDYLENVQTGFEDSDHNPVIMKFTFLDA